MKVQLIAERDEYSFGDCSHLSDLLEDPSKEVELCLCQTLLPRYLGRRDETAILEVQPPEECFYEGVKLLLEGAGHWERGGFVGEDGALVVYACVVIRVGLGVWCPADCCHLGHVVLGVEAVVDEVGAPGRGLWRMGGAVIVIVMHYIILVHRLTRSETIVNHPLLTPYPFSSLPSCHEVCYNILNPMQASSLLQVPASLQAPSQPRKQIDTRWVQLKFGNNFSPRSYFAACIQAGNVYLHGGFSAESGILKEFYTCCLYDRPAAWRSLENKAKSTPPGALRNHTLTPYLSNLILAGGQRNVVENNAEIYRYDLLTNRWSICQCLDAKGKKFPLALDSHAAIIHKSSLYLMTGFDSLSGDYFPDVAKISLESIGMDKLTYQVIKFQGEKPSLRANASVCLSGETIFLFGGGNVDDSFGDLWSWKLDDPKWTELPKCQETIAWPDRRKGGTLIPHESSGTLFLFGGIKKVTKEQNDVMVYIIAKRRWIKIHSSTNQLYDPSPTLKQLAESPTIAEEKRKREKNKAYTHGAGGFKMGIHSVSQSDSPQRMHDTTNDFKRESPQRHNATEVSSRDFKRKISVVQEKKYRDFLNRKKKLLSHIQSGAANLPASKRRSHSPTSQALLFSLNCMGEQPKNDRESLDLPKVIFDAEKGYVIGKKPCARDGHAALLHEECMIILGGDRHMVAFNDAYMFRLDKGVQSLPHYQ